MYTRSIPSTNLLNPVPQYLRFSLGWLTGLWFEWWCGKLGTCSKRVVYKISQIKLILLWSGDISNAGAGSASCLCWSTWIGLQAHWLRILAFRIMALLGDIAGYDLLCDPALDLWNAALSLFSTPDKQSCWICAVAQRHIIYSYSKRRRNLKSSRHSGLKGPENTKWSTTAGCLSLLIVYHAVSWPRSGAWKGEVLKEKNS